MTMGAAIIANSIDRGIRFYGGVGSDGTWQYVTGLATFSTDYFIGTFLGQMTGLATILTEYIGTFSGKMAFSATFIAGYFVFRFSWMGTIFDQVTKGATIVTSSVGKG